MTKHELKKALIFIRNGGFITPTLERIWLHLELNTKTRKDLYKKVKELHRITNTQMEIISDILMAMGSDIPEFVWKKIDKNTKLLQKYNKKYSKKD